MKIRYSDLAALALAAALALGAALPARADTFIDPYEHYDESEAFDMEIEENLATPVVQKAEHGAVAAYMKRLARQLLDKYDRVETLRSGEVIAVTLPSDDLFLPNDTLLTQYGTERIRPMLGLFKDPDMFKLVYAVHTDDTGSESYLESLASARNQAIYAWLLDVARINQDQFVINYDMADSMPLAANDSRKGRAFNRRVEFFIIPGPKLIILAHKNKLK